MQTVAPASTEPHSANCVSCAACASAMLAALPPPERQGRPMKRASWPAPSVALTCSGVPKAGAPDFMSTLEEKLP